MTGIPQVHSVFSDTLISSREARTILASFVETAVTNQEVTARLHGILNAIAFDYRGATPNSSPLSLEKINHEKDSDSLQQETVGSEEIRQNTQNNSTALVGESSNAFPTPKKQIKNENASSKLDEKTRRKLEKKSAKKAAKKARKEEKKSAKKAKRKSKIKADDQPEAKRLKK